VPIPRSLDGSKSCNVQQHRSTARIAANPGWQIPAGVVVSFVKSTTPSGSGADEFFAGTRWSDHRTTQVRCRPAFGIHDLTIICYSESRSASYLVRNGVTPPHSSKKFVLPASGRCRRLEQKANYNSGRICTTGFAAIRAYSRWLFAHLHELWTHRGNE